ncbi:uncharacterized protein OCT59_029266 [Rhizophagus irregularis]|uniref:uncharacterized protein n=1 Tax=Rhizophagus irregularis TaxID=588596 RepID=UPI00332273F8|nr:hypothetical protein OCT59_029266 [Rhizophagus irregularis]
MTSSSDLRSIVTKFINIGYQLPFKVRLKGNFKKVDFLRVHESKQFLLRRELRVWVVVEEVRLLLALAAALVSLVYWAMIEGREQQKKLFLKKQ